MRVYNYDSGRKVGRLRLTFNVEIIHIANTIADIKASNPGDHINKQKVTNQLKFMLKHGGYDKMDFPTVLPTVADYDLAKKLFPELI